MNIMITRTKLTACTIFVWAVFAILFFLGKNPFQLENIFGVVSLALIPGMNTLFAVRMERMNLWATFSMAIALSLLELMLVALLGNYLLPRWGILRPLDSSALIIEASLLYFVTMTFAWVRSGGWEFSLRSLFCEFIPSKRELLFVLFPSLFIVQAVLGAFSLNNGGSDMWSLLMVAEMAIFLIVLTISSRKLSDNTLAAALSVLSLSLLLMTSMRGWLITGHDIQNEYVMFTLTRAHGIWSMDFYRDPYNACLSITILPTLFSALLRISDVYIYKILFQIFFATVAGLSYLISRYWLKKEYAVLSTIYFIGFPTFFLDMPFMVRQETAFIFFGLMLFIIFNNQTSLFLRRTLFLVFGLGVVLSHYSTTYTVILISVITVAGYPLFAKLFTSLFSRGSFQQSILATTLPNEFSQKQRQITLVMVVILTLMSFVWTSLVTKTGGSLARVVNETVVAVKDGFIENNRSVDVAALLSFNKPSQQHELNSYVTDTAHLRANSTSGTYYSTSTYEAYAFKSIPDQKNPPTVIGNFFNKSGVDSPHIVFIIGQVVAKMMEILAPFGLLYLLFRKKYLQHVNGEIFLLSISSFLFIAMNIILPVLSNEYGILRALQQSLFIIGFLIVIATASLGDIFSRFFSLRFRNNENEGIIFPLTIAIVFFLYGTAFFLQLFGGNTPQLHFNNSGRYYDQYYITESKVSAIKWLVSDIRSADPKTVSNHIQADSSFEKMLISIEGIKPSGDIFPAIVRQDAFVVVPRSTFVDRKSSVRFGGDQIFYTYPISFLDENKDLIYDNGNVKIYR